MSTLHSILQQGYPCLVPVNTAQLSYWNGVQSQHAVVVIGMDEDYVYLNDPEFTIAPMIASHGDFDLAWFDQGEHLAVLTP